MISADAYLRRSLQPEGITFKTISYFVNELAHLKTARFTERVAKAALEKVAKMMDKVPKEISEKGLVDYQRKNYEICLNSFHKYLSTFLGFFEERYFGPEPHIFLPEQVEILFALFSLGEQMQLDKTPLGEGTTFSCLKGSFGEISFAAKKFKEEKTKEYVEKYFRRKGLLEFQLEKHPNILRPSGLLRQSEDENLTYFIMYELAIGNFQECFRKKTLIDQGSFKANSWVLRDIAKGLEFLKRSEILHFDLKPPNVLVYDTGFKISDFGHSRRPGEFCQGGSPAISSPEILELMKASIGYEFTPKGVDFSTDVWSFGMFAFFLLSNGFYFSCKGTTKDNINHALGMLTEKEGKMPLAERLNDEIQKHNPRWNQDPRNEEIHHIMLSCLQRVPTKRPLIEVLVNTFSKLEL